MVFIKLNLATPNINNAIEVLKILLLFSCRLLLVSVPYLIMAVTMRIIKITTLKRIFKTKKENVSYNNNDVTAKNKYIQVYYKNLTVLFS